MWRCIRKPCTILHSYKIIQRQGGHVAPGTLDPLKGQRARGHEQRLRDHLPETDTEQEAGAWHDEDGDSQDKLTAADHPREWEATRRKVLEANRRIVGGQRWRVVEHTEGAITAQEEAGREAQEPASRLGKLLCFQRK